MSSVSILWSDCFEFKEWKNKLMKIFVDPNIINKKIFMVLSTVNYKFKSLKSQITSCSYNFKSVLFNWFFYEILNILKYIFFIFSKNTILYF